MGARSRRKGAAWERALVRQLLAAHPSCQARRGFQMRSGTDAPDVDVPGLWIEAKHGRKVNLRAALAQAIACAPPERRPLAICKDDRTAAVVVIRLADFLPLVRLAGVS
jgi:hypothetical protein